MSEEEDVEVTLPLRSTQCWRKAAKHFSYIRVICHTAGGTCFPRLFEPFILIPAARLARVKFSRS